MFDGDDFLNHNAFRCPGAAAIKELRAKPRKVHYLKAMYSKMRQRIFARDFYIDATTSIS